MEIKSDTWLLCSTTPTGSVPRWWRSSPTSSPSWPATELMLSVSPQTPSRLTLLGSKQTSNNSEQFLFSPDFNSVLCRSKGGLGGSLGIPLWSDPTGELANSFDLYHQEEKHCLGK